MDDQKARIRSFLIEFKGIAAKRGIVVIPRKENIDALAELGLTYADRKHEILSVSVADYCAGPEPDTDKPGQLWIFGKQVGDVTVYIKLKIVVEGELKIAKCLSFHIAKFPMCLPYKKEKEGEK